MDLVIGPWREEDVDTLREMMWGFLEAQRARRSPILPTGDNAAAMVELGMCLARRGDPTLVAKVGDRIVGWIVWGNNDPEIFETAYLVCHTYASFVDAEFRHQGISEKLRAEGLAMARGLGYQRIDGDVYVDNARGIEHFEAIHGAKALSIHYEYEIEGA